jgi:hypothetical protein
MGDTKLSRGDVCDDTITVEVESLLQIGGAPGFVIFIYRVWRILRVMVIKFCFILGFRQEVEWLLVF